ncbi:MAG: hypothetical protein M0C28_32450 [Candidatus Moduliflexus flocculans]|nr:hypothetical protein [Candidatus Moduliflexus flocculans]
MSTFVVRAERHRARAGMGRRFPRAARAGHPLRRRAGLLPGRPPDGVPPRQISREGLTSLIPGRRNGSSD